LNFSRIAVVAEGSTLGARQVVFSITRPIEEAVSVVPGVTRVRSHTIRGATEIAITFAPGTDMAYSLQLVRARVGQVSGALPVGRVAQDYQQYLIVTDQEAHGTEDIGRVVLPNGLRVRDVARVQVGTEDHVRIIAGDGKPAALINVTRQVGGNTLALADSVARIMTAVAPTLPPGVHLKPVYDQAELVREAVRSVRDAMLIGAALAVVVLLLF